MNDLHVDKSESVHMKLFNGDKNQQQCDSWITQAWYHEVLDKNDIMVKGSCLFATTESTIANKFICFLLDKRILYQITSFLLASLAMTKFLIGC